MVVGGDPLELQFDSLLGSRSMVALVALGGLPRTRSAFMLDPLIGKVVEIRFLIMSSIAFSLDCFFKSTFICIATWSGGDFLVIRLQLPLMLPSLDLMDAAVVDGGGGACRDGTMVLGPLLIWSGSCTAGALA